MAKKPRVAVRTGTSVIEETPERERRVQSDRTLVAQQEAAIPRLDGQPNLSKKRPQNPFFRALRHIKGYRLDFSGAPDELDHPYYVLTFAIFFWRSIFWGSAYAESKPVLAAISSFVA